MLDLLDYRRQVFDIYRRVREMGTDSEEAYSLWKDTRDQLFASHTQSALDMRQKANFSGLNYWPYNPAYRVISHLTRDNSDLEYEIPVGEDGIVTIRQFGTLSFTVPTGRGLLGAFWIEGYGGGIFIPFRDATNGKMSYGGGRYLYDTIKGADLGNEGDALVLDFNYSYHPSCYYNSRWICPLAPKQNQLSFHINAGEQVTPQFTE